MLIYKNIKENGYLSFQWLTIMAVIIILCTLLISLGGALITTGESKGVSVLNGTIDF